MSDRASETGAVLMETVLAIPLYMIMLGGIFWIGDLTVTRQQLLISDRYVAWNTGLRYDDRGQTGADTVWKLFFSDKNGIESQDHKPAIQSAAIEAGYDWSHVANGQVRLDAKMPDWVDAMVNSMKTQYNEHDAMDNFVTVYGRETAGQRHVVLMRTKPEAKLDYIRNKYGVRNSGEVSTKWKTIAGEKWPYE